MRELYIAGGALMISLLVLWQAGRSARKRRDRD